MLDNPPENFCLPAPSRQGKVTLEQVIAYRRSWRCFCPEAITQAQLSQVLWAAQGITQPMERLRSAPSAGATFPLETMVVGGPDSIEGLSDGIYRYNNGNHSLTRRHPGDVRLALAQAAQGQGFIAEAPVDIVISGIYRRATPRYHTRGERYVHLEAGHAGQNIYLQALAIGLATVAVGAFDDEMVREVLQLDQLHTPLYIMPLGKPAR
ncbi:MAG: SagB/ThcOx family dehydrogenase [Chloroflexota bacterium]